MSAQVLRLGNSVAERYARLMSIRYEPADQAEAIAQHMKFAIGLTENGFALADLERMKAKMRGRLIRQLAELNRI